MHGRLRIVNDQLPPATSATLTDNGARPINQPCASTSRASTHGEGRRVHPRLHDLMMPEENTWPTTSLRAFYPKKSMTRSPRCRKLESDKKNLPISSTVVHFSLTLYKLYKRPCAMIRPGILDHALAFGGY
jgi:hypothetical protein